MTTHGNFTGLRKAYDRCLPPLLEVVFMAAHDPLSPVEEYEYDIRTFHVVEAY